MDDINNKEYFYDSEKMVTDRMLSAEIIQGQKIVHKIINHNKPWRIVIRRIVSDGRSDYENISGNQQSN